MNKKERTCYVQVVYDLVNGKEPHWEMYPEFAERGHSEKAFNDYVKYVRMALYIVRNMPGNPNTQKEYAQRMLEYVTCPNGINYQKFHAAAEKFGIKNPAAGLSDIEVNAVQAPVPRYRLTEDEINVILTAEEFGSGPLGKVLEYEDRGRKKSVLSVDYRLIKANVGGRPDIFLVYSGHQQTGFKAAEMIYNYIDHNGKLPEGVFHTGLEDNQNLTEFNEKFKFRRYSEADTYASEEEAMGIPKSVTRKMWIRPTDTDTFQNIDVTASIKRRFGIKECNLIIIGYPVYQLRTATEFAWGLSHNPEAPDCYITIADIPTKQYIEAEGSEGTYDDYRVLSYDQPEWQLADLSLANCCAHVFRGIGTERFALPMLKEYPEMFQRLAVMFLGYSYPNVVAELCGENEDVARVMKIIRHLMLCRYDKGMSGAAMDKQEQWYAEKTAEKLESQGLTSRELMEQTRNMSEPEFLRTVLNFQRTKL